MTPIPDVPDAPDISDVPDDARAASSFETGEIDPLQVGVLLELWAAWQASPDAPWSLAKLAKRVDVPMSALRRSLTQLDAAGLVAMSAPEATRATAALSAAGRELCARLLET